MKLKVNNITSDTRTIRLCEYTFTYNLMRYNNVVHYELCVNESRNFALSSVTPFFVYKLVP